MHSTPSSSTISTWYYFTGTVLFSAVLLYLGRALFIPLGFSLFISIVLYPVCRTLEQKGIGRTMAIVTGLLLITVLLVLLLLIFGVQLQRIFNDWPFIREKLSELSLSIQAYITEQFGWSDEQIQVWLQNTLNTSLGSSVGMVGTTLQSLLVNLAFLVLIPIYAFLILFYRRRLVEMLISLLPGVGRDRIVEVLRLSVNTYFRFIKGMSVVYLVVGTLNSVGLWLMGVPYAFLFGFLTAVMTFIPYVGIIVASILPITYAWVTYGIIWYPLGVVALFAVIQYLEANIIFPLAVGQRLELNTLATLVVIFIGGILWGASGMILFIPLAAILKLIADRMEGPGWEALARFLGNGPQA
ncbi:MAG: AI-2E family transporter [Sphingobacteriales bacterium]|jgi:predicted PurR-regulated permease PerM|nr:AI-2E family transporter [Sphingobacteriales bacterium]